MPSPLDKLIGLSLVEIGAAMRSRAWEREMERIIRTAHTAAWLTATAERLGVRDPGLIKRPSRAERAEIDAAVRRQVEYLRGFAQARAGMSDAAALARARMYAGGIKPFFYQQRWGQWEIPERILPGMQACMTQCGCELSDVRDNGDGTGIVTRVMTKAENHCPDCPGLQGDHPVKRKYAA